MTSYSKPRHSSGTGPAQSRSPGTSELDGRTYILYDGTQLRGLGGFVNVRSLTQTIGLLLWVFGSVSEAVIFFLHGVLSQPVLGGMFGQVVLQLARGPFEM
jgi:hypothetical protein